MKKVIILVTIVSLLFVGCKADTDYESVVAMAQTPAVDAYETSNVSLSSQNAEEMIYKQVTDRELLDVYSLDSVSDADKTIIYNFIEDVDNQLKGSNNGVLKSNFLEYILFEMQKTTHAWDMSSVEILGIDSSTRSFVVDVTFSTREDNVAEKTEKTEENNSKDEVVNAISDEQKITDEVNDNSLVQNDKAQEIASNSEPIVIEDNRDDLEKDSSASINTIIDTIIAEENTAPEQLLTPTPIVTEVKRSKEDKVSKRVLYDSVIPMGCEDYNKKMQVRMERYLEMLRAKTDSSYTGTPWQIQKKDFEATYGSINKALDSQIGYTLQDKLMEDSLVTYNCFTDSKLDSSSAVMKFRLILSYKYILGINKGMECNHLYLMSYNLSDNPLEDLEEYEVEGSTAIVDNINNVIYCVNKAIEESDFNALYKYIDDFGKYDKHYYDMFRILYSKTQGYTLQLYNIDHTHITAGVTRVRKIKPIGSNMSYPTYEETILYEFDLIDDSLKIVNEVLVSSTLIGEPNIVMDDSKNTEGFTDTAVLDEDTKKVIENVICDFDTLQVNSDLQSDKFSDIVDISMSYDELTKLRSTMSNIGNIKSKATWIKSYLDVYDSYVTVALLEVFFKEDGTALECESEISLILKNNSVWQVMKYERVMSTIINSSSVSTESAQNYTENSTTVSNSTDESQNESLQSPPDEKSNNN